MLPNTNIAQDFPSSLHKIHEGVTLIEPRLTPELSAAYAVIDLAFGHDGDMSDIHDLISDSGTGGLVDATVLDRAARVASIRRHPSFKPEYVGEGVLADFEKNGFAFSAPKLGDQVLDSARTFEFSSARECSDSEQTCSVLKMKELDGLRELRYFLDSTIERFQLSGEKMSIERRNLLDTAISMRERLTFIGETEYFTAVTMIGGYWQEFLNRDEKNKIFVVTGISNSEKYPGVKKSDQQLYDRVEEYYGFSNPDSPFYGRVVNGTDGVEDADSKHTKVILLDDWALSGTQISRVYFGLRNNPYLRKHPEIIEANFIASSGRRIRRGMAVTKPSDYDHGSVRAVIPVKAVYKAHDSLVESPLSDDTHITGLHSSANYGFSTFIDTFFRTQRRDTDKKLDYPAIAAIIKNYQ